MADIEQGDQVITPTDEVADVLGVNGHELQLEYRGALVRERATFSLRATLCALWLPGRPRPAPIRRKF